MRCEDEAMGGRCSYSIPHPSPFTHGPPNVSSVQTQRGRGNSRDRFSRKGEQVETITKNQPSTLITVHNSTP